MTALLVSSRVRGRPALDLLAIVMACFIAISAAQGAKTRPHDDRFALVIAPAGDSSRHLTWLEGTAQHGRNWDLILLYYDTNENFTCPQCLTVWRGGGAKWAVLHRFLSEEPAVASLADRYCAVTVMDDDLHITTDQLNAFFQVFVGMGLSLGQPSLCPGSYSYWWAVVGQRPDMLLHYTSFVELMAPTASGEFFDAVIRPTLNDSYTGWGLDFVWPFLAGFPHDRIAVVDSVCMLHAGRRGGAGKRVYEAGIPWHPQEEWEIQMRRHNLTQEAVQAAGLQWNVPHVWGEMRKDEKVRQG